MADIRAFRGYRYDLGRAGKLGDVVAPPYDVIDPALQDALYARSPFNVVRLILNREEASDSKENNRYTRASRFLRDWLDDGILARDSARALYVYEQEFDVEGARHTRRGFLARVRLEPFGQGSIFPHEETMPGPKADRLRLFQATHMNLSPVFGLYPDEAVQVQGLLADAVRHVLPLEAVDHLGVISRLWIVTDQHVVSNVTGLMGPRPIFIADGHHRYETALRYRDECPPADVRDPEAAANFVLMMFVGMSDPGLVILPTHRLVSGIDPLSAAEVQSLMKPVFQMETIGKGDAGARQTWERIQEDGRQNVLGVGTVRDDTWRLARFVGPAGVMERLAPERSSEWRGLAVSLLHSLILGEVLAAKFTRPPQIGYVHLLQEVIDACRARDCQLAILVPPASMRDVAQIAGNLEKMPPKSTYFYPKLLSGLVLNSLKGS
jgi:uncharacterized protein (DUF1015 family)